MKKDVVKICMGSSCFSRGNKENLETIKIFFKENGLDAEILLVGNLCEGSCNTGPNIFINDKLYENVTPSRIQFVLSKMGKDLNCVRN